ncbi:hypothetical protein CLV71_10745 [Actinophytocola oryzae]|uniref:Uncharacterized protein n=1 Tax=Actinophytocola oryzae TaxID=502181 RepID=A0A4R7VJS3_9PSEU|nr:hypothetical protein CLV71_10745 [Actinophytocola oryzae]
MSSRAEVATFVMPYYGDGTASYRYLLEAISIARWRGTVDPANVPGLRSGVPRRPATMEREGLRRSPGEPGDRGHELAEDGVVEQHPHGELGLDVRLQP